MKRDPQSPTPAQALRDLPVGSRLVTQSTTKVLPLETTPPQEAASMTVKPTTSVATPPAVRSHVPRAIPTGFTSGARAIPGRVHNSTFDDEPPHVEQARAKARLLRGSLRGILSAIYHGTAEALDVLQWIETEPEARAIFASLGINLEEADTLVREARALLDRFKPPVAPVETPAA